MQKKLIQLSAIGKRFGSTRVLEGVSLDLFAGEVHLLAGENGAGKSTLIKILSGIHADYEGRIELDGRPVRFATPQEANRQGISVIHQEMSLVDTMSVADNIFLGREPSRGAGWWLDRRALRGQAWEICRTLDLEFTEQDLDRPAGEFSLSVKNRIEIAKALSFDAKVLIMDEPTSALNRHEVEKLFQLIGTLKACGCGILYISHKMEEIYRIADRITVLRGGRGVGTAAVADCPRQELIRRMIGREMNGFYPHRPVGKKAGAPALCVKNFHVPNPAPARPAAVKGVSFEVAEGEIVGIAGLQGSGATELFHGLFGGYGPRCTGEVFLKEGRFEPRSPQAAIRRGLAYLTGDRKATGLVSGMSVVENITLAALPAFSPTGVMRPGREHPAAEAHVRALRVRLASLAQAVGTLSGGNQQKVALAKWLETKPHVLLLEEPTRGIDVGAKEEIYELMNACTRQGMAFLMISTEMPELLGVCDRILVFHRGEVTGAFERGDATAEKILQAAMGSEEALVPSSDEK